MYPQEERDMQVFKDCHISNDFKTGIIFDAKTAEKQRR